MALKKDLTNVINMLLTGLFQHGSLSSVSLSGIYSLARAIREPSLRNLWLMSVLLQVQWFVGFTSLYSSLCTGLVCSRVWSDWEWEGSGIWLGCFSDFSLQRFSRNVKYPAYFNATMTWYWTRWVCRWINWSKKQQNTVNHILIMLTDNKVTGCSSGIMALNLLKQKWACLGIPFHTKSWCYYMLIKELFISCLSNRWCMAINKMLPSSCLKTEYICLFYYTWEEF